MAGASLLIGGFGFVSLTASSTIRPNSLSCLSHLANNAIFLRNNMRTFSFSRFAVHGPRKVGPAKIRAMAASSGSELEESVKKTITENPVLVYSKTWCPYSSEVKSLFKRIGVQPLVIELDELGSQGPQLQEVLDKLTGQTTVPNVFIGGKHIGGCTDTYELYENGELEPLLSEASAKRTES
ncbi:hypothetical protein F0562_021066 [Nyssa sinensis]|uniref:Glutaredoxin domain-containing protein n=1 Tax=Nyssa sinensis TaxID=561372 RepID=A0A5J5BKT3_9ASTE|nr:hypothetical protein F0562_021066 [Nyssa sinensis]